MASLNRFKFANSDLRASKVHLHSIFFPLLKFGLHWKICHIVHLSMEVAATTIEHAIL